MHGWMSIRTRRCADARVHGVSALAFAAECHEQIPCACCRVPRANSSDCGRVPQANSLRLRPSATSKFLRLRPSATSKFLRLAAECHEQIPPSAEGKFRYVLGGRIEEKIQRKMERESTKKTNCYFKKQSKPLSFFSNISLAPFTNSVTKPSVIC